MEVGSLLHIILCILISTIGITANIILMFAIAKSRSTSFRSYSIILFAQSAFESLASLSSLISIVRVVKVGSELVAVFYGPCVHVSEGFCSFAQRLEVKLAATINCWFVFSFMYRYCVIAFKPLGVVHVSVCAAIFVGYCSSVAWEPTSPNSPNITDSMLRLRPDVELDGVQLYTWSSFVISFGVFQFFLMFFAGIICCLSIARYKIKSNLRSSGAMRESTKSLQNDFINALTAQGAVILLSLWSLCTFWFIPFFEIRNHFLEASSFMAHSLQFTLSPLTTIYFVKPYTRFVREKILRIIDITPSTSSRSSSSVIT